MPASKPSDPLQLPLDRLKGISDKRSQTFAKLGIEHQLDLLFFYPRAYEDWTTFTALADIQQDGEYTFQAQLTSQPYLSRRGKLAWVKLRAQDRDCFIEITFFNQPWLTQKLRPGMTFVFHGKVELKGTRRSCVNPAFVPHEQACHLGLLPIYPLTQGLSQKLIRQAVQEVLQSGLIQRLTDPLPDAIRKKYRLATLEFALNRIHAPENQHELELARRRLAFDELFLLRSSFLWTGDHERSRGKATPVRGDQSVAQTINALRQNLPFDLTPSQVTAINDIFRDLRQDIPMNRLLQGDVGSGKTMVALFAAVYVCLTGGQVTLMAPTAILAQQHLETFRPYFDQLGLRVDLLLGSTKTTERASILEACAQGKIDLLIGTHALLEDDLQFNNLVLTMIDEQHRFGVRQRFNLAAGRARGDLAVHRLLLTATPIPRSLAMIFFQDLDMSVMRGMPAGRQQVKTRLIGRKELPECLEFIRGEIQAGGQAYVICPLIAESEKLDLHSAEATYEQLAKKTFPELHLALLHGQLDNPTKEAIMSDFARGEIDILVSTTVVEVGVDNPRATVMLIMSAERFGLAQLHQLRGRVGRGERQAYCFLYQTNDESSSQARLETLVKTNDGFVLAEEDLKQRGPGDFFGTRQHGLANFKLLNIYEDQQIIQEVKAGFEEILTWPLEQQEQCKANLDQALLERYPHLESGLIL